MLFKLPKLNLRSWTIAMSLVYLMVRNRPHRRAEEVGDSGDAIYCSGSPFVSEDSDDPFKQAPSIVLCSGPGVRRRTTDQKE